MLSDMFRWGSRSVQVSPFVQWNILNYGQITNSIRVQDARFQQLLLAYQRTVLAPQHDVEDNLVAFLARRTGRISWPGASPPAGRRSTLAEDIVPAEIKAEMRQRTNWGDLLAPAAYNPPASRQPQYAPGFRIGDHVWTEKLEPK
jgi:hypothetical protein